MLLQLYVTLSKGTLAYLNVYWSNVDTWASGWILGVHQHVFYVLIEELHELGYTNSKYVTLEEQLNIFLCHWLDSQAHWGEISKIKWYCHLVSTPNNFHRKFTFEPNLFQLFQENSIHFLITTILYKPCEASWQFFPLWNSMEFKILFLFQRCIGCYWWEPYPFCTFSTYSWNIS